MLITYTIILIFSIFLKMNHFPGGNTLLVFSPILILIDLIRISIVKNDKKYIYVLSSFAMLFVSLFITFKFLSWPGASLIGVVGIPFLLIVLILAIQAKLIKRFRYVLLSIIFLFATFNSLLKTSTFKLTYETENPFAPNSRIPHWKIQSLAFAFYKEGDYDKAEQLINKNINHLNDLIEVQDQLWFPEEINKRNLEIAKSDLENIKNRTWNTFTPMNRTDLYLDE